MSDFHDTTPVAPERVVGTSDLLSELISLVEGAKSMPLSASVLVSREEVLGLLHDAAAVLPVELGEARHVLKDQQDVVESARRDAAQLLDEARAQAAHMVERTEVVRQARDRAERLIAEAEADARRTRHDADDYVDRKLAAFEIVLDRTMRTVAAGRERLTVPTATEESSAETTSEEEDGAFFDQDLS